MKTLTSAQFPGLLREIPDPPKKLFLEGQLPGPDEKLLAVVGSRKYSSYGKEAVDYLISGLSGYPITIVSGLALGIDALAHKTALRSGLNTIAVPGSGLSPKVLYPRTHYQLAKEILKSGGALLSEFEPDTKAAPYTFPQRNRIMAGMSQATLIIEAGEKSGTLITARLTVEYNRDLLVVPGSIFSPGHRGAHQFLRLGATPVTSPEDILEALGFDTEKADRQIDRDNLSPLELKVVEIIEVEPLPRDELIRRLGISITEANSLLSVMEIKDLIKESLGEVRIA